MLAAITEEEKGRSYGKYVALSLSIYSKSTVDAFLMELVVLSVYDK